MLMLRLLRSGRALASFAPLSSRGLFSCACACAIGCSPSPGAPGGPIAATPLTDAEYQAQVVTGMHDSLLADIDSLLSAAQDLQTAAPAGDSDASSGGWSATSDPAAVASMKAAWIRARTAYEHSEGAIAPLFPTVDNAIDARYDDFLEQLAPAGDPDLFDGKGVTGMHAIERILYVDTTPARVVEFEKTLPGYVAAAFPANGAQAAEFKTGLAAELVTDVTGLRDQWKPTSIHVFIALEGLIDLMNEQREKVVKAASDEEESRYSQRTMADIRDNLDGTKTIFALFEPWLLSKKSAEAGADGPAIDAKINTGFQALADAYGAVTGDAFPQPPSTWSSENPSAADLATPFGQLYSKVNAAVDPTDPESVVSQMVDAAAALGTPVPSP